MLRATKTAHSKQRMVRWVADDHGLRLASVVACWVSVAVACPASMNRLPWHDVHRECIHGGLSAAGVMPRLEAVL